MKTGSEIPQEVIAKYYVEMAGMIGVLILVTAMIYLAVRLWSRWVWLAPAAIAPLGALWLVGCALAALRATCSGGHGC